MREYLMRRRPPRPLFSGRRDGGVTECIHLRSDGGDLSGHCPLLQEWHLFRRRPPRARRASLCVSRPEGLDEFLLPRDGISHFLLALLISIWLYLRFLLLRRAFKRRWPCKGCRCLAFAFLAISLVNCFGAVKEEGVEVSACRREAALVEVGADDDAVYYINPLDGHLCFLFPSSINISAMAPVALRRAAPLLGGACWWRGLRRAGPIYALPHAIPLLDFADFDSRKTK